MSDFQRARSDSQQQERREMILHACEEIYFAGCLQDVTFNTISEKTSLTRPALYNYYRNREEILMGLLKRYFHEWSVDVVGMFDDKPPVSDEVFCQLMTELVAKHARLFQLFSDMSRIEQACEVESIVELRSEVFKFICFQKDYLRKMHPDVDQVKIDNCIENIALGMFGIYEYSHCSENQNRAIKAIAPGYENPGMQVLFHRCITCAIDSLK